MALDIDYKNKKKSENLEFLRTPQLSHLSELSFLINSRDEEVSNEIISLKSEMSSSISFLLKSFKIEDLELISQELINSEIVKCGLMESISSTNIEVAEILKNIGFFNDKSSYLSGFFSSEFSADDLEKWKKAENLLFGVYSSDCGILKQAQDYFLFKISKKEIASMVGKEIVSFEEELFLRSILVKGYLANLRQLILPFYSVDDNILIDFKKKRISELEKSEYSENAASEISLLKSQIENFKAQEEIISQRNNLSEKLSQQKITLYNKNLNAGSVALGTIETARYFTSFVGHKTNINSLKAIGNFGLKGTSFFAKCIPVVSAITEAGTQMNNNYVIYNYEKQLKIISLVDNVKTNLVILEQQVTDYYINSILSRLQEKIIEGQTLTFSLINKTQEKFLSNQKSKSLIENKIENVSEQYHENVSKVKEEVSTFYQNEILKRENTLAKKNREIAEKEIALVDLDKEYSKLEIEVQKVNQKLKNSTKDLTEKTLKVEGLDIRISSLEQDLSLASKSLETQRNSLILKEKALKEAVKGNFQGSLILEFDHLKQQKEEAEMTVNVLIKKQNELETKISKLTGDIDFKGSKIEEEKETLEILNDHLQKKLTNLQSEKKNLILENSEHKTKLLKSNQEISNYKTKNSNLQGEIDELKDKVSRYSSKKDKLEKLEDNYNKLSIKQEKTLSELEDTKEKLSSSEIVKEIKEKKYEDISNLYREKKNENSILKEQIKEFENNSWILLPMMKKFKHGKFILNSLTIVFILTILKFTLTKIVDLFYLLKKAFKLFSRSSKTETKVKQKLRNRRAKNAS